MPLPVANAGRHGGFTLVELLVTLAVLAILLALAVPSFGDLIDRGRLTSAADTLYADLQFARSEAIRNNQNVVVSFQSGGSWCYGMVLGSSACDCSVSDSAAANYCALKRVTAADFSKVSIPSAASITFASGQTGFDPVRGVALSSGAVTLQSAQGKQATVSLALLGRVSLCSPAGNGFISAYPAC
ncbi:GspH/FimT family pseudopilin [Pseudogulbenkiania subflava]|uniref:Type II secretion system protein H n=1 Tax=Pseudogulbenkiania subflava DSM 22618 TaxID=1123014 RepID=A0A1Y6B662_9NEIS|nr:GspH/FimT family pseudopilin [Pseudogulbenkiania subflava]SME94192.1 type IV fimbrial biogenesis protein FimT [Pseudogulbenkiania subflava DSM 22618]